MPHFGPDRPRIAESLVINALTLAALALLASVLAYWTWAWLAPAPEARMPTKSETPRIESAYALFGSAPSGAASSTGVALKLLGVAAASGNKPGHALLRLDEKQTLLVRAGEAIGPGLLLVEVHPDHVEIDRDGTRETLRWPQRGTAAPWKPAAK
jgi:general secretion pathway protein C